MSDVAKVENFVDGVTTAASSNDVIEVVNPSTGARIAEVTASSDEDVDEAVRSAARAFPEWSALTPGERSTYLHRLTDLFERDMDRFADLEVRDAGKPTTAAHEIEFPGHRGRDAALRRSRAHDVRLKGAATTSVATASTCDASRSGWSERSLLGTIHSGRPYGRLRPHWQRATPSS